MLYVVAFLSSAVVMLSALPAHNLYKYLVLNAQPELGNWWDLENLYRIDDVLGLASLELYQAGISTAPEDVFVGKDGWLFLGDKYASTVTIRREGPPAGFDDFARQFIASQAAWDTWLQTHGVQEFRTIIGPNKSSMYPELLPDWMISSNPTLIDAIMAVPGAPARVFDPRTVLETREAELGERLYFKFDTHWAPLGAHIAAQAFLEETLADVPDAVVPEVQEPLTQEVRRWGDLAAFLHVKYILKEQISLPTLAGGREITTTRSDLFTEEVTFEGGNPVVFSPQEPVLVTSPNGMNDTKVLWLRDSFGNDMSPYMATAFTQVVQVYWDKALLNEAELLVRLVQEWQPDIVLVTVVERSTIAGLLAVTPPA